MFIFVPSSFKSHFSLQSSVSNPQSGQHHWITLCWPSLLVASPPPSTKTHRRQLRAVPAMPHIPRHGTSRFPASVSLPVPGHPPAAQADLPLLAASVSPVLEFSFWPPHPRWCREHQGPSSGSQHRSSLGAEPWQGEGAAYAEQMESIKTKGSGPASIYYPSKVLKCIYRHSQPYGDGESTGATPVGRETQGQLWVSTGSPPSFSQLFSPLHRTPRTFCTGPQLPAS